MSESAEKKREYLYTCTKGHQWVHPTPYEKLPFVKIDLYGVTREYSGCFLCVIERLDALFANIGSVTCEEVVK